MEQLLKLKKIKTDQNALLHETSEINPHEDDDIFAELNALLGESQPNNEP